MPVEATIQNAEKAMALGDKHRAIEILRSSLGNYGYSPELLKAYGDALHANGNLFQAGGFYFVSCRTPTQAESDCISNFIKKHQGPDVAQIVYHLPKVARYEKLSMYPDYVQERLRSLGAEEILISSRADISDRWSVVGCIALFSVSIILALIGAFTVIMWIFT